MGKAREESAGTVERAVAEILLWADANAPLSLDDERFVPAHRPVPCGAAGVSCLDSGVSRISP